MSYIHKKILIPNILFFLIIAFELGPGVRGLFAEESETFPIGKKRVLIIVVDGLRPDYVTPEIMPNLSKIKQKGFYGQNHHAVYPTSTRINSSSIATGTYPQKHGLMNNSLYLHNVNRKQTLNTGKIANLKLIEEMSGGLLLTTKSLGDILASQDKKLFISSSGSSGSAYLLASPSENCTLIHREIVIPDSFSTFVEKRLGPGPEDAGYPRVKRIRWSVDALLKIGIDTIQADAMVLWMCEPDGSAHSGGIGSSLSIEAVRLADREIARILNGLEERDLLKSTNLLIISDHGFSTRIGKQSLSSLLIENGLKSGKSSTDVVIANDAIYVNEQKEEKIPQIVQLLQKTAWVGPVFTRGKDHRSMHGRIPGTLSFASVMWDHQRSADILMAGNWTDSSNEFGFKGDVRLPGTAGHNSTSPYDIRASFFAVGPDIKSQSSSTVPTGNVDIVPTVLYLFGLSIPEYLDGRIIREAIKSGPLPSEIDVQHEEYVAETEIGDIHYKTILYKSFVNETVYLDSTVTTRY